MIVSTAWRNDVTRSRGLDGGGGVFLRVESRAARPQASRQLGRGLDARRGPKTWERPADGFRTPCAARTAASVAGRARVPAMAKVLSLPIGNIINSAHFYDGGARGYASAADLRDHSPASFARHSIQLGCQKTAETRCATTPSAYTAEQPAFGRAANECARWTAGQGCEQAAHTW